jgi:hypothetical protein
MKASDIMTSPVETVGRAGALPGTARRHMTLDEKLDEALKQTFPASDAFVVAWEPRALDVGQAD